MLRRPKAYPSFLERRRSRQDGRDGRKRTYTFELAALHLTLLIAMAAVDDEVRTVEVDEVLGFLDRSSLPPQDVDRLQILATHAVRNPPDLEPLLGQLDRFSGRGPLATMLVTDLARVAAADQRADQREVEMLHAVCDSLGVAREAIVVPDASAGRESRPASRPVARLVDRSRVRAQVRRTLEQTYSRERDVGS